MIKGSSLTADAPNIEEMSVSGEAVTGSGDFMTVYIKRNNLTTDQKVVYDEGVAVVSGKYYTEITNTTSTLNISRVTSTASVEGQDIFDFDSLSTSDQDALRALLALFVEFKD